MLLAYGRRSGHSCSLRGFGRESKFGQSEIQDLGMTTLRDKNVRRLDVPVNDTFAVGGVQRIRHLDTER